MSESQTRISEDILLQHSKVASDEVVDVDVEENIERELLDDTPEPISADMYLLQEMHSDMQSFKSCLDWVEKGQSNVNSVDNNSCDKELAPKHDGLSERLVKMV